MDFREAHLFQSLFIPPSLLIMHTHNAHQPHTQTLPDTQYIHHILHTGKKYTQTHTTYHTRDIYVHTHTTHMCMHTQKHTPHTQTQIYT